MENNFDLTINFKGIVTRDKISYDSISIEMELNLRASEEKKKAMVVSACCALITHLTDIDVMTLIEEDLEIKRLTEK